MRARPLNTKLFYHGLRGSTSRISSGEIEILCNNTFIKGTKITTVCDTLAIETRTSIKSIGTRSGLKCEFKDFINVVIKIQLFALLYQ